MGSPLEGSGCEGRPWGLAVLGACRLWGLGAPWEPWRGLGNLEGPWGSFGSLEGSLGP